MVRIAGLLLLAAAAGIGQGQTVTTASGVGQVRGGLNTFTANFPGPGRFAPPAVQGMPYSAEEIQERQQTLGDGTHIQQTMSRQKLYRDAQGRTRTERTTIIQPDGREGAVIIEITDPVAGVQYALDTQNKIAHRVALQALPTPGSAPAGGGGRLGGAVTGGLGPNTTVISQAPVPPPPPTSVINGPVLSIGGRPMGPRVPPTIEKLGNQVMEGVLVEGQRQTTTIPAGSQGNDRDIHAIFETWTSPDLKMAVYRKTSDPRTGDSIMRLTNISRNDPDPQLFQPPADYQMVDETGPFSIHYQQ